MEKHPRIAVSAALFRGDDVLLIERSEGQSLEGLLSFPGGTIDFGETLREGVAREVLEEVGLTVQPEDFVFLRNHEAIYETFHFVICVFAAQITDTAEPVAGSDAASVRFVRVESVRRLEDAGRTTPRLAQIAEEASSLLR